MSLGADGVDRPGRSLLRWSMVRSAAPPIYMSKCWWVVGKTEKALYINAVHLPLTAFYRYLISTLSKVWNLEISLNPKMCIIHTNYKIFSLCEKIMYNRRHPEKLSNLKKYHQPVNSIWLLGAICYPDSLLDQIGCSACSLPSLHHISTTRQYILYPYKICICRRNSIMSQME